MFGVLGGSDTMRQVGGGSGFIAGPVRFGFAGAGFAAGDGAVALAVDVVGASDGAGGDADVVTAVGDSVATAVTCVFSGLATAGLVVAEQPISIVHARTAGTPPYAMVRRGPHAF